MVLVEQDEYLGEALRAESVIMSYGQLETHRKCRLKSSEVLLGISGGMDAVFGDRRGRIHRLEYCR